MAIGWFKEDFPFGKLVVFQMNKEAKFEVQRECKFYCSWNEYKVEPILDENQESFADNEGFHNNLFKLHGP